MPKRPSIKVGDRFTTNQGYVVTVIEHRNYKDVTIRFENGFERSVQAGHLKRGVVKNPMHPSVYDVGYIGIGSHPVTEDGVVTQAYETWMKMIQRCYHDKYQKRQVAYIGCYVADQWHNFQNFAEWYEKQPNSNKSGFALDKDLMIAGNKQYGPETCSLVPQHINNILLDCGSSRGDWPQGVTYHEKTKKYVARVSLHEKSKYLGLYETSEEAFSVYKRAKEKYVREQAEKYKDVLHPTVYSNLRTFRLEGSY